MKRTVEQETLARLVDAFGTAYAEVVTAYDSWFKPEDPRNYSLLLHCISDRAQKPEADDVEVPVGSGVLEGLLPPAQEGVRRQYVSVLKFPSPAGETALESAGSEEALRRCRSIFFERQGLRFEPSQEGYGEARLIGYGRLEPVKADAP